MFGVADKVIEAVKNKAIRHFFLVAGCETAPSRAVIITHGFVELVPRIGSPYPCLR